MAIDVRTILRSLVDDGIAQAPHVPDWVEFLDAVADEDDCRDGESGESPVLVDRFVPPFAGPGQREEVPVYDPCEAFRVISRRLAWKLLALDPNAGRSIDVLDRAEEFINDQYEQSGCEIRKLMKERTDHGGLAVSEPARAAMHRDFG